MPDKKRRICKKCGIVFDWKVEGWHALMHRGEIDLITDWRDDICRGCNIVRYYSRPMPVAKDAWKVRHQRQKWEQYPERFHQYDIYAG